LIQLKDDGVPTFQVSTQFLQGMVSRMGQGYHKYGPVKRAAAKVDFIATAEKRIAKYLETGNTEWLMDAANYMMCEFMYPHHVDAHYRPTAGGESPGRTTQDGNVDHGVARPTFHSHEGD
jgi:hypothetical protein